MSRPKTPLAGVALCLAALASALIAAGGPASSGEARRQAAAPALSSADSGFLAGGRQAENPCANEAAEQQGHRPQRPVHAVDGRATHEHQPDLALPAKDEPQPIGIPIEGDVSTVGNPATAHCPNAGPTAATSYVPGDGYTPDGDIAISPHYFVAAVTHQFTWGTKNTAGHLNSYCTLINSNGGQCTTDDQLYDVTVAYSTYGTTDASTGGRFVIEGREGGQGGWDWILISKGENPDPTVANGWYVYRFQNLGEQEGQTGVDPLPGTDKWSMMVTKQLLVVQTNGYCCGTIGWDVFSLASLATGAPGNYSDLTALGIASHQRFFATGYRTDQWSQFHDQIMATMPATLTGFQVQANNAAHFIQVDYEAGYVYRWYFDGSPGAVKLTGPITVGPIANFQNRAVHISEPDFGANAYYKDYNDNTVMDAKMFVNAQSHYILVWTGEHGCPSDPSRSCAFVGKLDLTSSPNNYVDRTYESAGSNILIPAVAPDSAGNAVLFFSDVKPSLGIPSGGPAAAFMGPAMTNALRVVLPTATTMNNCDPAVDDKCDPGTRWGDYAGASLDPSPNNGGYVYGLHSAAVPGNAIYQSRVTSTGVAP